MAVQLLSASSDLSVFWQDGPASIDVNGSGFDQLASEILSLVGNSGKEWTLILSIGVPFTIKDGQKVDRTANAYWQPESVVNLLQALKNKGIMPSTLGYHPDLQSDSREHVWEYWGFPAPADQTLQNLAEKTVKDMMDFNAEISKNPGLQEFNLFQIEGKIVLKQAKNGFDNWRNYMDSKSLQNVKLFATGNWAGAPVFADGPDVSQGMFYQMYNYFNKHDTTAPNPLVDKPTDPSNAQSLGTAMFESLQGIENTRMNGLILENPGKSPQIFDWSDMEQSHAPVFRSGSTGVVQGSGWGNADFQTFLNAYSQAFAGSERNPTGTAPLLGVWGAEHAIPDLAATIPQDNLTAAISGSAPKGESNLRIDRYGQDLQLLSSTSQTFEAELEANADYANGIGLFPLHDSSGTILASNGNLLAPTDPQYNQQALGLSKGLNLWFELDANQSQLSRRISLSLEGNTSYALITDSRIDQPGGLFNSIRAANEDEQIHIAPVIGGDGFTVGFEDSLLSSTDYNDIVFDLSNSGLSSGFSYSSVFVEQMIGM